MSGYHPQRSADGETPDGGAVVKPPQSERAQAQDMLRAFFSSYDEIFLLTGPAASGKTALAASLLTERDAVAPLILLDGARLTENGLINAVCRQLGLSAWSTDWEKTLQLLGTRLRQSDHAFLIIDNAHHLGEGALEELRLLSYLRTGRGPQLQMVLIGHETLRQQVEASDMARLGLWHIRRAHLSAVTDNEGDIADTTELAAETPCMPLQPQYPADIIPPSSADVRGELALFIPRADANPGAIESTDERPESGHLPVAAVPTAGGTSRWLGWRPVLTLALLLFPAVLLAGYWVGYYQAQESIQGDGSAAGLATAPSLQDQSSAADEVMATGVLAPSALAESYFPLMPDPGAKVTRELPLVLVVAGLPQAPLLTDVEEGSASALAPTGETVGVDPVASIEAMEGDSAVGINDGEPVGDVAILLAAAADAMAKDRLRTPRDSSAWTYFNQVLTLEPDNSLALSGIEDIARRYELLTRVAIEREKYGLAQTYITRGLDTVPEDQGLSAMQRELDAAVLSAQVALLEEEQRLAAAEAVAVPVVEEEKAEEPGGLIGFLRNVFSTEKQ